MHSSEHNENRHMDCARWQNENSHELNKDVNQKGCCGDWSFYTLIGIGICIRVFCIGYTILWNHLIPNYKHSNDLLCKKEKYWKFVRGFSFWDGEYFLRLSLNETEYFYEHNLAFFPALPMMLVTCKNLLKYLFSPNLYKSVVANRCTFNVLLAVIINNFFFVLASIGVYVFSVISCNDEKQNRNVEKREQRINPKEKELLHLSKRKDEREYHRFASFVFLLYSLSIGNIHVSSFYNESIFSFFSIWGFIFLQISSRNKRNGHVVFSFLCEVNSVLFYFIASCFRSNGVLFLIPLFFFTVNSCKFCQFYMSHSNECGEMEKRKKEQKTEKQKKRVLLYFSCKGNLFQFCVHWLKALLEAILVFSPFLLFQLYSFNLYCTELPEKNLFSWVEQNKRYDVFLLNFIKRPFSYVDIWRNKHMKSTRPWCNKLLPFSYGFIQKEYWNVQFLKFIRTPNVNIFYSAVVYFICFHCVYTFFKQNCSRYRNNLALLLNPFFGSILHLFVLSLYLLFFAHNEIILRLVVSCPIFFVHYAQLLRYFEKWNFLFFINMLFFFIGPAMFGTYIMWT